MDEKTSKMGSLKIADDVLLAIIGIAATEVPGVESLAGGIRHDMITRYDMKNISKSIKITAPEHGTLSAKIALILDGTVSIPEVTQGVRAKVAGSIESMTGLKMDGIDVTVAGVNIA